MRVLLLPVCGVLLLGAACAIQPTRNAGWIAASTGSDEFRELQGSDDRGNGQRRAPDRQPKEPKCYACVPSLLQQKSW